MSFFACVTVVLLAAPANRTTTNLTDYPIRLALTNGGSAVDRLLDSAGYRALEEHPAWKAKWNEREARQGLVALRFLAGSLQTNLRGMVRTLLSRTVAVYVDPATPIAGAPRILACVDLGDPATATQWLTVIDQAAALVAPGDDAITDGPIHSANGREYHAVAGSWLLASNDRAAVEAARVALESGAEAVDPQAPPRLAFDLDVARLRDPALPREPARRENGVDALLGYGLDAAGKSADRLAGTLEFAATELRLDATLRHPSLTAEDLAWYVAPRGAVPSDIAPEGTIATLRLDRGFGAFYREHAHWLAPASENDFVQFDNAMNLFFGGRSFGEEILPALSEGALLLVTAQDFAGLPKRPRIELPAFTLLTRITPTKLEAEDLGTAFQNTLAIVNLDRAGKGGDSLRAGMTALPNGTLYSGRFAPPKEPGAEPLDLRFNFSPALTVASEHLVISSAIAGAEAAAHALASAPQPRMARPALTELCVDLPALGAILGANREALVAERMLKEGEDHGRATQAIDFFLSLFAHFHELRAAVELEADGHRAQIALTFATEDAR